ncbi:MAG: type II toxin-antitoxin system HicA family toxin [Prolixibacteraceae bacterium]|nr:type II toxin-antitoxin system HicA family toxin [Prolixibacteraceae bacterium]
MKKIPRDITGYELIKIIGKFGYQITRQTGSHIRLTTKENGIHHVTVPNHNPLRIGTLPNILSDIADHFQISKKELLEKLF